MNIVELQKQLKSRIKLVLLVSAPMNLLMSIMLIVALIDSKKPDYIEVLTITLPLVFFGNVCMYLQIKSLREVDNPEKLSSIKKRYQFIRIFYLFYYAIGWIIVFLSFSIPDKIGQLVKKREQDQKIANATTISYQSLPDIVDILTNHDAIAIEDCRELIEDHHSFAKKHQHWFDEMDFPSDLYGVIMAYWITGYETQHIYGAYIDWKEETNEIICSLKLAIEKLGYPLNLQDIIFTGDEFTHDALKKIDSYFNEKGYTLVTWDIESDCYHLFITTLADYEQVRQLGQTMNILFYNKYGE